MAPRRRSRKSRNTRMDAAVDAMTKVYGFSAEIVKKILKELLKEYGGDDGWFFIEQYSYKELVEAILRDQEENDQCQINPSEEKADILPPEKGSLEDVKTEEQALLADAARFSGVLEAKICSKAVEKRSEANNKEDVGHLPPTERDDIGLDLSSSERERVDAICVKKKKSDNSSMLSPLPRISFPTPVQSNPSKKHQPCYGWIESDVEEADDFIYLKPAVDWEDLGCKNTESLS